MHIPLRPVIAHRVRQRHAVAREGNGRDGPAGGGEHVLVRGREADRVDGVDVGLVGLGGGGGAVAFELEGVEAKGG